MTLDSAWKAVVKAHADKYGADSVFRNNLGVDPTDQGWTAFHSVPEGRIEGHGATPEEAMLALKAELTDDGDLRTRMREHELEVDIARHRAAIASDEAALVKLHEPPPEPPDDAPTDPPDIPLPPMEEMSR